MTINRFPPYYDLCLRCREKGLDNVADFIHELYAERELLRTLVHHAFCEGQITSPKLDDWKNSEVYAALKEGE
jgi:hypothetical protein